MTALRSIVSASCCLLVACQSNPFANRFLKKEPALPEAVGTYRLTEAYVSMIEAGLDETIDGMIFTFYDGDQGQILGFEKAD